MSELKASFDAWMKVAREARVLEYEFLAKETRFLRDVEAPNGVRVDTETWTMKTKDGTEWKP